MATRAKHLKIEVFSRSVYGEVRIYAADKSQADALGKITGTKTLTAAHIDGLKQLGLEFVQGIDPLYRLDVLSRKTDRDHDRDHDRTTRYGK
jgi:hypothetical protein